MPPENTIDTLAVEIKYIKDDVDEVKGDVKEIRSTDIKTVNATIKALETKVEDYYLTIKQFEAEFKPIRNIIWGLIGLILSLVVTAVVYLVLKGGA